MVEVGWLINRLQDSLGDLDQARNVYLRHARELSVPEEGMLDDQNAYQILDHIKGSEPGLAAVAASTLKVRMMILLQSRPELRMAV